MRRILLLLTVALTAVVVNAEDFTVNGIKYTGDETTMTATVTGTGNLTDLVIPETVNGYTVTKIGAGAFWRSDLKSVHIPASVTEIEYSDIYGWSFTGCPLENITVDAGNSVFDSRNNCNAIIETASNNLLQGCKTTVIPDDIVSIGKRAFEEMYYSPDIHIPNSVKTIGERAFYMCGLKSIDVPNSVTSIGAYAFALNDSLSYFSLPESLTEIEEGVFCLDNSLVSVTNLPSSLQRIGEMAFCRCRHLETIIIPESVTTIDDRAFQSCMRLDSITIPASVTHIGEEYTFAECELHYVVVDKENKVYDSREGCNAIIRTADNKLLYGASTSFIPSSVTAIGDNAFSRRKNLESITIPAGVTSIGYNVFVNCDQLNTVTSLILEPFEVQGCLGLVNSTDNDKTLFVTKGTVEKYKATDGWNWFGQILELFDTGDVNGDGQVGIADIVAVTNVMASITTDADVKARADVNGDGQVGIADIVAITNIMAGK